MMVWITIHMLFHSELMLKPEIVQSPTLNITDFAPTHTEYLSQGAPFLCLLS